MHDKDYDVNNIIPALVSARRTAHDAQTFGKLQEHTMTRTMSRNALLVGVLAAGTALAGCDPGSDEGVESALDSAVVDLAAADVRIVATSDALATVYDLEVLADGDIWVLNSIAPFFVGFDSAGTVIDVHGAEGGGPDEVGRPVGFVTRGVGGEVWAFDQRRHLLVRVSTPEQERAEIALPRETLPPGSVAGGMDLLTGTVRTALLGERVVLPRLPADRPEGVLGMIGSILKVDLVALDPASGEVEPLVSLREVFDDPFEGFEATAGGFPLWRRLWAVCGGGEVVVFDREANRLRRFDASGADLASVELPPAQPTSVTPRQFATAVFALRQAEAVGAVDGSLSPADSTRLLNEMIQEVEGTPAQLAAYLPRYVDLRCTDGGTIWLRPIDVDTGLAGAREWLKIGPDGRRSLVGMPDRFDPLRFTEARVWGVQRDAFDVVSVAWIPLP